VKASSSAREVGPKNLRIIEGGQQSSTTRMKRYAIIRSSLQGRPKVLGDHRRIHGQRFQRILCFGGSKCRMRAELGSDVVFEPFRFIDITHLMARTQN